MQNQPAETIVLFGGAFFLTNPMNCSLISVDHSVW